MDAPVICDAYGEERRRSARIFRNVCITLLLADLSLRDEARTLLARFGRFCQLLLRIWRWPRPTSRIFGVVCTNQLRRRGSAERRAGFRASIEGGAPAPEHHLFLPLDRNATARRRADVRSGSRAGAVARPQGRRDVGSGSDNNGSVLPANAGWILSGRLSADGSGRRLTRSNDVAEC